MHAGTERPRFRQDLLAEAIDEQGARFIDVMDPDSGAAFRFYEVEFSIACGMDGERDVPGLVQWARDELGVTPTPREVQTVIATLGDLGYLDMAAASRAAASDVPAASGLAAAGAHASDTVLDVPAMAPLVPVAPVAVRPVAAAAAPGTTSEVSLDLSEHLAVGREDVQEAVRQSRVMAAVEMPTELTEPPAPPVRPVSRPPVPAERPVSRPPAPIEVKQPEPPVEAMIEPLLELEPPIEARQPEPPIEARQPEPPIEVRPPEPPIEVRPVEVVKPAIELPKVPEKQPAQPVEQPRRLGTVLVVLLILVVLGIGAFLVWKLVLDKSGEAPTPMSMAPVVPEPAPPPEPPGPPPKQVVTSKIELSAGRPKTILAFFPGVIEWIEASSKEVKSNDIIMMLQGHKTLEAQVASMTKEVEKLQAEMSAAYKARDAAQTDPAALKKAQAKVEAAEKAYNLRSDQLVKKSDQLEPYYVRLTVDGTITILRKAGEKIAENTPIATIATPPAPSAVFKIPPEVKLEVGSMAILKSGERLLTCEIGDWEPRQLRVTCPPEAGAVEGSVVSFELP